MTCAFCGRSVGEHSHDTRDICNRFVSKEEQLRCNICGFLIDNRFEAAKPTIEYTQAGRTKRTDKHDEAIYAAYVSARALKRCAEKWGSPSEVHRAVATIKQLSECFPFIGERVAASALRASALPSTHQPGEAK